MWQRPRHARPSRRSTIALALAAAVVLLGGACATTLSGPTIHARAVTTPSPAPAPTAAPVRRIVVLGDSVPAGSRCACLPFGELLARQLTAAQAARVTVTNQAVPGLTTAGLIRQLASPATRRALAGADVVTLTIGANDFVADRAARPECLPPGGSGCFGDELSRLPALVDQALARVRSATRPGTRVLATGYWNVFLDGLVGRGQGAAYVRNSDVLTRRVNTVLAQRAARAGADYVDLYGAFEHRPLDELTDLLADDGDHPSAAGHALIARLLAAALGTPEQ